MKTMRIMVVTGLVVGLTALLEAPASGQVSPGSFVALASNVVLTNGSTTTINAITNVPQGNESIQLMAIISPNAPNAPTNGCFCTNIVMKFNFQVGTNITTDTPFTWTLATDVFGAMSQTTATNPICCWTNLTNRKGLTGLQLTSALPSSTNTVGPKLTVLMGRSP